MRRRGDCQLVLIDFGIAKLISDNVLRQGTAIGSLDYVAPEQAKGKALPASDLYSLGVTCLRLLTGVSPSDIYDVIQARWQWRQYLGSSSPEGDLLGEILDKLLHPAIGERYSSAREVLQALSTLTPSVSNAITVAKTPSIVSPLPETTLISSLGVDYTKLADLLSAHNWKAADRETWNTMCLATNKPVDTQLEITDIEQFPCQDLQLIDYLWVHHSQGHFGFSVQRQIYESVKRDYINFCHQVKWSTYNSINYYKALQFSHRAPKGHLPSRIWVGGVLWLRHATAMAMRLQQCSS